MGSVEDTVEGVTEAIEGATRGAVAMGTLGLSEVMGVYDDDS